MDELEISGKRYISTRRAAREHGYHSDYMGQLIRSKKVAGQKVGRAWYIEEQSLAAYLGKELQPVRLEQQVQPEQVAQKAPVADVAPAVVERVIVEEPAAVVASVPVSEPVVEVVAPHPVVPHPIEVFAKEKEEAQPIVVRIESQPESVYVQPMQEIHHAPIERYETRIPLHKPVAEPHYTGGLRYAAEDTPSIPIVTRMPQAPAQAQYHAPATHAPSAARGFPYVGLSIVGIIAIAGAVFASNFVSATIVSEEGKAATVQYAIHW